MTDTEKQAIIDVLKAEGVDVASAQQTMTLKDVGYLLSLKNGELTRLSTRVLTNMETGIASNATAAAAAQQAADNAAEEARKATDKAAAHAAVMNVLPFYRSYETMERARSMVLGDAAYRGKIVYVADAKRFYSVAENPLYGGAMAVAAASDTPSTGDMGDVSIDTSKPNILTDDVPEGYNVETPAWYPLPGVVRPGHGGLFRHEDEGLFRYHAQHDAFTRMATECDTMYSTADAFLAAEGLAFDGTVLTLARWMAFICHRPATCDRYGRWIVKGGAYDLSAIPPGGCLVVSPSHVDESQTVTDVHPMVPYVIGATPGTAAFPSGGPLMVLAHRLPGDTPAGEPQYASPLIPLLALRNAHDIAALKATMSDK